jgi:hypothetical protein
MPPTFNAPEMRSRVSLAIAVPLCGRHAETQATVEDEGEKAANTEAEFGSEAVYPARVGGRRR